MKEYQNHCQKRLPGKTLSSSLLTEATTIKPELKFAFLFAFKSALVCP